MSEIILYYLDQNLRQDGNLLSGIPNICIVSLDSYLEAYNEAAALAAANYEEKKASNADAELVDKYNKAKRSKSLVEKHQESTRVKSKKKSKVDQDKQKQEWEGEHPWKPWDREKDLTAGRQNVKLDAENMAQGLTSRFSSGSFQRNFL